MRDAGAWIGWAIIVGIIYLIGDWGFLTSEITSYSAMCAITVTNNRCAKHSFTMGPTTYKVFPNEQTVVYRVKGLPVERLTKCAVADRKNWTCRYNDESAEFGFKNGKYFMTSLGTASIIKDDEVYHLSRFQYLLFRIKGE